MFVAPEDQESGFLYTISCLRSYYENIDKNVTYKHV